MQGAKREDPRTVLAVVQRLDSWDTFPCRWRTFHKSVDQSNCNSARTLNAAETKLSLSGTDGSLKCFASEINIAICPVSRGWHGVELGS